MELKELQPCLINNSICKASANMFTVRADTVPARLFVKSCPNEITDAKAPVSVEVFFNTASFDPCPCRPKGFE